MTYATVQPFDNTIGNETYGVFFAGGAGNGAYAYDFNTGSRLEIGTIISQGGPSGNYSASFIWSYRNMTIIRDYSFTISIPKSAFGSTTSLQAKEQAPSKETPCDPLLEKLASACGLLGTTEDKEVIANWFEVLDMTVGLTEIPGAAILSVLFTALDIACFPIELASCNVKLPGCSALCQESKMTKTLYSENVCIDDCFKIYPDPCCPIEGFARFFCASLSSAACDIGCGVCGFNGYP